MKGALREAHAHIAQHGRAMGMLRLADCRSLDDGLGRLAAAAARTPAGRWLLGDGIRIESWADPRWPTAADLDAAAPDQPVCLWSFDYHQLILNTPAMRALGLSARTPDPEHGRIVRDAAGAPNGRMIEAAAKAAWSGIPEPTEDERREQVLAALRDLTRHGFTEVHDLLAPVWLGPVLASLHDAGLLPMSVLLYPRLEEFDEALATAAAWQRPSLRLAGAKVFADGTLNSRTAFMLTPYADPLPASPRGQAMMSRDQLAHAIHRTRAAGLALAVHAIGDAAVRAALDAWESTAPDGAAPRLRIEHAEIIDRSDVPRFARLGVVCSVQPCHLLADVEALERGLPHRLDRVLPLRELIDTGCTPGESLIFGSDVPIVRPDPQDSIQAAVHRRREGTEQAIAPAQAISEAEARVCFSPAGPLARARCS